MKNTKLRRTLSIVLSIIMVVMTCTISFGLGASAADEGTLLADGYDIYYTLEDGVLTFTGTGAMPNYGYDTPFAGNTSVTTVIYGEGITSTGNYMVYNCTAITKVVFSSTITTISSCTFRNCTGLTYLIMPENVTSISTGVFNGCTSLTTMFVPSDLPAFGNNCFSGISNTITVYYQGTQAEFDAVANSTSNNSAYINATVVENSYLCPQELTDTIDWTISGNESGGLTITFSGTGAMPDYTTTTYTATPWYGLRTMITEIVFKEGITTTGTYSFYGTSTTSSYSNVTSIHFPSTITVSQASFYYLTGLTSLIIPEGVTTLSNGAFRYCTGVTAIYLPTTIKTIGSNTTGGISSATIYYAGSATDFASVSVNSTGNPSFTGTYTYNTEVPSTHECTWEVISSVEGSCTVEGTETCECTYCGKVVINNSGYEPHTYSDTADSNEIVEVATCTSGNGYAYTCTECNSSTIIQYDDQIDSTNHSGTERKYIDDDGNVQTYWTCCQTTSYLTDLAELILDNWATVTSFATTAPTLVNNLDASGYLSRTFTVDDYDTYIAVAEIAELTIYVLQEIVENSEAGYTGTTINSTTDFDFDIWSTYKINYDPDEGIQALLKAEIASLIADSSSDYYGFSDYSESTITNFYQYFVPGANDTSSSPTQKALATLSTFQDDVLIDVIITTTDSSGYYDSGTSYADLSTTTTMSFNMDLVTTVYDGQSYSVEGLRSAAAMSIKTTTESSFSDFETAAEAYIAAVTAFNTEYSTAAALYAAGDDADDSAITAAATALATYGVDVEVLFADNTQYNAYTAKLAAIADHEDGHSTYEGATVAATCCSAGYTQTLCHDCNFVSYTYTDINANNHLYETQETVVVDPTCTEDGGTYTYWYCCGSLEEADLVDGSTVASPGHSYVVTETIAATCCTYSSETKVCATCGDTVTTTGDTYDENTHVYDDGVFTDGETCTDNGYTTFTCTNPACDASYTVDETGADHVYELTESVEATCTEEGHDTYKCENCEATYTDTYEPTGHYWWFNVGSTPGDCQTQSTTTLKCADCEETTIVYGDYGPCIDENDDGICDVCSGDVNDTSTPDVDDGDDDDDSSSSSGSSSFSFWDSIVAAFQNFFAMIAALFTF